MRTRYRNPRTVILREKSEKERDLNWKTFKQSLVVMGFFYLYYTACLNISLDAYRNGFKRGADFAVEVVINNMDSIISTDKVKR